MAGVETSGPGGPSGLLVFLHGHGSGPAEVHSFFRDGRDDGWSRVCPAGPHQVAGGQAWFLDGPRGADAASLQLSTDVLVELIDAVTGELDLQRERIVLGGFSQGAAMALALAADERLAGIGGLLLQAGFVPETYESDFPLAQVRAGSVLIQHGVDDDVVPSFMSKDLAAALTSVAALPDVGLEIVPGDHSLSPAMVESAQRWLGRL